MRKISPFPIVVALISSVSQGVTAQKRAETQQEKEAALTQLIEKHFDQWDRNHDGNLELAEVDRQVENHNVQGRQAAVISLLRRRLGAKDSQPRISHNELLKLAKNPAFEKSFEATVKQLETIDRELFLPTDPDLSTFHQGRLGDCYLLSTIANGYPTDNGVFTVPLDEFRKVFTALDYETDKPLHK